jgi:hypothetical protein
MAKQQDGPKGRGARYRELAGEALATAANCKDKQTRTANLMLAERLEWVAAEVEFLLH